MCGTVKGGLSHFCWKISVIDMTVDALVKFYGEAPAEPMRRKLGRSLALSLFFKRIGIAKMGRVEGHFTYTLQALTFAKLWRTMLKTRNYFAMATQLSSVLHDN